MIKIENVDIHGWEAAIRGARNPMNSWEKSDSWFNIDSYYASDGDRDCGVETMYGLNILGEPSDEWNWESPYDEESGYDSYDNMILGPADRKLLMNLCKGGPEESKWRRFVNVTLDITAPLYWWKEFETYKVGTVSNSCSTMHKIQAKEFTLEDFSCEHLLSEELISKYEEMFNSFSCNVKDELFYYYLQNNECSLLMSDLNKNETFSFEPDEDSILDPIDIFKANITIINIARNLFLETKDKRFWWQMIQLLPSSYNQRRTIQLNYEVLAKQYRERKEHKLDEWRDYCEWIKGLPYAELITMEETK